jgi:hypothetical protein
MSLRFPSRARLAFLLSLLVLVSAAAGILAVFPADAGPAHGTHVKIFDNCSDCNQIGFTYYNCDGVLESSWGVQWSDCMTSFTYGCEIEF